MYRSSRERGDDYGDPLPLNIYDSKTKHRRGKKGLGSGSIVLSYICTVPGFLVLVLAATCWLCVMFRVQKMNVERTLIAAKKESNGYKLRLETRNNDVAALKREQEEWHAAQQSFRDKELQIDQMHTAQTELQKLLATERERAESLEKQLHDAQGSHHDETLRTAKLEKELAEARSAERMHDASEQRNKLEIQATELSNLQKEVTELKHTLQQTQLELQHSKDELNSCFESLSVETTSPADDLIDTQAAPDSQHPVEAAHVSSTETGEPTSSEHKAEASDAPHPEVGEHDAPITTPHLESGHNSQENPFPEEDHLVKEGSDEHLHNPEPNDTPASQGHVDRSHASPAPRPRRPKSQFEQALGVSTHDEG
mmetsp:Transcript_25791/g.48932  ORF Transcript_25791/g.48932 Transcript_25791/m.48932 type:complete len:369 (-) Transcript_25791:207-1313(-)|eukprot:CAMPEP_0114237432 /NCGR_PEP_ID=MMETSP0058-20121206/7386_1 /TAXON_ID=36894 /ORGANISM="Pyramimonas parkeae, CCMP726" /LENGTH=368 /DNA_ID=CAMNT_0001349471 /DNA_START=283 /DNA_END=1389 /DNA_ORIENTATION=+